MRFKGKSLIDNLGKIITGKTPSTKNSEYWNGNIPFITPKDLQGSKHIISTERKITKLGAATVKGSIIPINSVCVSCIGVIGYVGITTEESVSNQQINSIIVNENNDTDYVYYLMKWLWPYFKNYEGQSTTLSILNKTHFSKIEIPIYPLDYQRKVSKLLSMIDDKIELNQQINKNLEEQAQAIFDNALLQSNSISYATLGSLADVKGGKRLPKGTNLITKPNSHPYIRVRDLNHVIFASLSKDYEYVDDETQKSISRYITSAGDVLISIVGTIGLTAIVDKTLDNANLTENCVRITNLKKITSEYLLLYLRSVAGIEYITKGTVGAVQLKLPIKNIQTIPVPLLSKNEIQSLCSLLPAIFDQIEANIAESKRLIDIRDALLPRLMSGEIDVSKIEI